MKIAYIIENRFEKKYMFFQLNSFTHAVSLFLNYASE
jgi:hypothetical protein